MRVEPLEPELREPNLFQTTIDSGWPPLQVLDQIIHSAKYQSELNEVLIQSHLLALPEDQVEPLVIQLHISYAYYLHQAWQNEVHQQDLQDGPEYLRWHALRLQCSALSPLLELKRQHHQLEPVNHWQLFRQ